MIVLLPGQHLLYAQHDKIEPPLPAWADETETQPSDLNSGCKGSHVLVVEDDALMREMLAEMLENMGCRVTQSETAFHWMEYCAGHALDQPRTKYDLVISDICLPGLSGLEVLEGVSTTRENPPTILITAYGDEQTHERARRLGAYAILNKPFAVQTLTNLVRKVLA